MSDITWTNCTVKLGDLKPWQDNPRHSTKAQAKRILASFEQFGQVAPIAVGPNFEVYDGHQRLSALLTIHGPNFEVEARQSSKMLTDAERRALVLALANATGSWNWDSLSNWNAEELKGWGMDADTLKGWKSDVTALGEFLKSEAPTVDAEPQIDRAAELLEKWQVVTGDLFAIGDHRLICGDCTDAAVVARVMGGERIDIGFTSPPYNVADNATLSPHQDGGSKYISDADDKTDDEYLQFLTVYTLNTLEHVEYSFVNIQSLANNKIVLIDLLSNLKDYYADTLIWDKMNAQPAMANNVLNSQFEYVHVFSKKGKRSIGTKEFRGTISNVVQIHKKASEVKEHNATFSLEFASFFVDSFSTASVFDGFCGSGTTLVACQNLNRRCRAIEISPAYVAVALERMATAFPDLEIKRV